MARTSILSVLLLTSPICAQLTVVTTASDFTVSNPTVATAPGVLAEPTELMVGQPGPLANIARLAYEVDNTGWPYQKIIWISGSSLAADWFDLAVGPTLSESLDATIAMTSADPMLVDIQVELTHLHQGPIPTSSALLDVGGLGTITIGDPLTTFRAAVDSNGFVMDYDMSNSMPWPEHNISGVHSHVILKLTLRPVAPQTSGTSCNGAMLDFASALDFGANVRASHPTAPVGLLILGTSTMDTPLSQLIGVSSNCPLRTDPFEAVPFVFSQSTGERYFNFVPFPGTWRIQLLTADVTGLSTSNVLTFQH
ncbi:MAG: hypothetical protein KDB80_17540 [Planctomycetes bacterium]|nr:hypothetical protein [Planctomycetota bacterium]